jgi:peptidoglycan/xylan/chitin deacetylase (PgdA/CDA1 family)
MEENKGLWTIFIVFALFLGLVVILINAHDAPEQRYVLLSFDVEPVDREQDVMDVLDVIYRQNVGATFFVTGEYAEQHPHIVKLMTGREIASHGYSHKRFTRLDKSERVFELKRTREVLENISGQKVIGFRAPYNLLDKELLELLGDEGYVYDASMVQGGGIFYPSAEDVGIGEIPVSSVFGIPLEDVTWLHYLRMPGSYFYILKHKNTRLESYLFHPHHIAGHKEEFEEFIKHLKKGNTIFISHKELIEMDDEGV